MAVSIPINHGLTYPYGAQYPSQASSCAAALFDSKIIEHFSKNNPRALNVYCVVACIFLAMCIYIEQLRIDREYKRRVQQASNKNYIPLFLPRNLDPHKRSKQFRRRPSVFLNGASSSRPQSIFLQPRKRGSRGIF